MDKKGPIIRRTTLPPGVTSADLDASLYSTPPILTLQTPGDAPVEVQAPAAAEEIPLAELPIPFASEVSAKLYEQWHLYAYVHRKSLREALEFAFETVFPQGLSPTDELPAKKRAAIDKKIQGELKRRQK